jgi:small-conductance mechanosensitive channel
MNWTHVGIAAAVIVATLVLAKLVDRRIAHHDLTPGAATRYRVLRRSIVTAIVFVGVFSALLVIPQVRAVAAAILASSAVIGIVFGFAAQRTLGNFVAGLLIAFAQPIRLGDRIEVEGTRGVVEEVGFTYTWVRAQDNSRYLIPNEKIVSETVHNSTIRSDESRAEVTMRVPASADLEAALAALGSNGSEVYLASVGTNAIVKVRRWIPRGDSIEQAESDLRLASYLRMRELGIVGGQAD